MFLSAARPSQKKRNQPGVTVVPPLFFLCLVLLFLCSIFLLLFFFFFFAKQCASIYCSVGCTRVSKRGQRRPMIRSLEALAMSLLTGGRGYLPQRLSAAAGGWKGAARRETQQKWAFKRPHETAITQRPFSLLECTMYFTLTQNNENEHEIHVISHDSHIAAHERGMRR